MNRVSMTAISWRGSVPHACGDEPPNEEGDFYSVETAFVARQASIGKKYELLWEKSETTPADSGNRPSFANLPPAEAGDGHPNGAPEQSSLKSSITEPENDNRDIRYSQDEDRAAEDAYDRLSRITDKSEFRRTFEALDDTVRRQVLGAFTRDQLGDIAYPILPEIKDEYLRTAYKLDADRNEIHHKVGTFMEPYAKLARKDRAEADRLADVMHEATLAGVDPAVRYKPVINIKEGLAEIRKIKAKATANKALTEQDVARINELTRTIKQELRRKEVYAAIKAKYDTLSGQSKDIYQEIRDYHAWFDEQLQDALEKRIEESDASPKACSPRLWG
jgi:hypothetical protein